MYGLPFPEASPEHAEASTSEQLLLRKEVAQRFGHSGAYRDLPFAVLFLLQLCMVVLIALVNGLSLSHPATPQGSAALPAPPPPPGTSSPISDDDVVRSHQLLLMLVVTARASNPNANANPDTNPHPDRSPNPNPNPNPDRNLNPDPNPNANLNPNPNPNPEPEPEPEHTLRSPRCSPLCS